jgi:hypothetical protein
MHRQILVLLALFISTGAGYIYMGWLYSSFTQELIWFCVVMLLSAWGYKLHFVFKTHDMTLQQKEL